MRQKCERVLAGLQSRETPRSKLSEI